MKHIVVLLTLVAALVLNVASALADEEDVESPWETYSLSVGYFISSLDTSIRLGTGIGVDLDAEDLLDLDETMSVARLDGSRRFGRHRIDFSWMSLNRKATRVVQESFRFENSEGEEVTVEAGATVESYFDLDLYEMTYSYSFIQDERIDLAAAFGLYLAPIGVGVAAQGTINGVDYAEEKATSKFTAPLPMIGLRMDVALTPKWFVRYQGQMFYLEYENFKGTLYASSVAVECKPWQHVGFGLGYDILRMQLEAIGEDYPEIDFKGNIGFQYSGLMLYAKLFF